MPPPGDATSDGPVFELCPPIGIGVAEFEEEPLKMLLIEYGCELELEPELKLNLKQG